MSLVEKIQLARMWASPSRCFARRKRQLTLATRASVEFTLHDLRRTFAGMLAEQNVPTTRIRDYLGHSSVATTETYYVKRQREAHVGDGAKLSLGIEAAGKGLESSVAV